MSDIYLYADDGKSTVVSSNSKVWTGYDPAVTNGTSTTITGTFKSSGTFTINPTTTTNGGTWAGTVWSTDPDMTDWPASDIIDYFARQLAERHPA